MDIDQEISRLINTPDAEAAGELMNRYPYFTFPAMMLLKHAGSKLDDDTRRTLSAKVALTASDPNVLRELLDPDAGNHAGFYPDEHASATPSTEAAIDKFIDTYGHCDPAEEELLTRLIFNPTPDYAQILSREEEKSTPDPAEAPEGSQDRLINNFIIKSRANSGHFPQPQPEERQPETPAAKPMAQTAQEDTLLSESLARIYIRQKRYSKAYEIISNLNLNFPEKSIYFADQLRFLQKLMLAEKLKSPDKDKN